MSKKGTLVWLELYLQSRNAIAVEATSHSTAILHNIKNHKKTIFKTLDLSMISIIKFMDNYIKISIK